ncbi:hypothetical protein I3760_01G121900 [Carya illinoinensis]|nr:hypothetical protein I3760_01G121900 [Carya illinoinensis]
MDGDALSAHIDEKLDGLTSINTEEHCIFKVHERLLKVNKKAYKPVLHAIGPYNDHDKVGQGLMEEHKLQYLKQMCETRSDRSVKEYIKVLRELDAKGATLEGRAGKCYVECISKNKDEFVEMMLLDGCFIIELFRKCEGSSPRDDHDPIFQMSWLHAKIARDLLLFENQLPFFVLTTLFLMIEKLKESGVKFKKAKHRTKFAIQFRNGVLEILPLRIEDETETFLRNLIAFEQYSPYNDSSYVTNYMCFMDDLIDSPKDVELLRWKGIIENWLGDDQVASTMVNNLGHHALRAKRWNERKAKLRHNYFNSPWALLLVLAAILLLLLAITQTVFSIIN